ncbi:hypothetical protein AMEX_G8159 [Astyanax mexicanus]|uniref:C2H2-type domain-containing protein n=1 Tax=Astyanax mexicanus TaxID=7994 RepID=A0A8T2M2S6_ASTMX|nr:hypothetical protein AMEX_G8159 [Astyanax mexicanus]
MTQQTQGTITWKVSNHYSLQGDSSEDDEFIPGHGLRGSCEDCVCCVCGETFTFLNNLIEHFSVHKGEVRCHLCQVTFTRAISLALHLENAHPNYHLYCESCKVMFWSTWHMNQHMGQHVEGRKVEPTNEDIKPLQTEAQKPLWLEVEVEEVMVKTEEVEVKCVKDEEEEVQLGKLQWATESISTTFSKEGQLSDHNYCRVKDSNAISSCISRSSSREQNESDANSNSEPLPVFNNRPNTGGSDFNSVNVLEEKVEVLVLRSLAQREEASKADRNVTSCEGRAQEEEMPSLSVSVLPKLEPEQLELDIKLEDDSENDVLECAPVEDDSEKAGVENVDVKEESDSSQRSSLYSPLKDISSDTDSAFDMSTDYDSDFSDEGSLRLLRSRAVKKRRVRFNTNEDSVSPENACAVTDPRTSDCTASSSIKITALNDNNIFSNYTCLSCLQVFPNQKTFMMHSCGKCKVRRTLSSSITKSKSPKEDLPKDHNYSSLNCVVEPAVSNQRLAHHSLSSTREQRENTEPVSGLDNVESSTDDSECEEQDNVEIVVLRAMPQTEGVTNTGRVVLQAAYEKVIKTQVRGDKPSKTEEQEETTKSNHTMSSMPDSVSVKLEPEQKEISIKEEDSVEDSFWECAPIEEDLENIKKEENTEIKVESDNTNLHISLRSPVEDSSTETDGASGVSTDDRRSESLEGSSTRELQPRIVDIRSGVSMEDQKSDSLQESSTRELQPRIVDIRSGVSMEDKKSDSLQESSTREFHPRIVDIRSGVSMEDKKSDSLEESSTRELQPRIVDIRSICTTNTYDKQFEPVKAVAKLTNLPSSGTLVNSVKVSAGSQSGTFTSAGRQSCTSTSAGPQSCKSTSAGPQSCTSTVKPINSVNPSAAAPKSSSSKDIHICYSCGLLKVPCACLSRQKTCYICREVCDSEQLLLKHQSEKHPLTKYVCSTCVQVFPNQNSFAMHACCQLKLPALPNATPAKTTKSNVKNPPTMYVKFIRPPAVPGSSNQPLNNGGSQTSTSVPSAFNFIVSNNVIKIVDASQNLLPNNPCPTQTVPVPSTPSTPNNAGRNVASVALNGGQASVNPLSTVTWTKSGQMQVIIPSASPAGAKPNQTEIVFQGGVPSQVQQVLAANSVVPETLVSGSSAQGCNQSKVALRIPSYPSNSNKVSVSFSPTPVQFPTPTFVSAGRVRTLPSTSHKLPGLVRPFVVPLPKPSSASAPLPPPALAPPPVRSSASPPTQKAALLQPSIINHLDPCTPSISPDQSSQLSQDSLCIVTMFVNQSQDLALHKRMRQNWRSKTMFHCRHCGIIARQPSLGIRHRYQHRGPRLHKCQCGRTFEQRLHLLRHQVQHAEAVRYVCAACGQTFHGTHQLACHKHKVRLKSVQSNTKKLVRRDCRNLFSCDCGQGFSRSSALLWHMLKNSKSCKRSKKGSLASDLAKNS